MCIRDRLWGDIAKQRRALRKFGGWEENWGAFRELHFNPIETKAIRLNFKSTNVTLDELEAFGAVGEKQNLLHKSNDVKVSSSSDKGIEGRNPVDRLTDGEYGTMTWRAKVEKKAKDRPWVQFDFDEPQTIQRLRLSSNREYFYDTDYLLSLIHI